MDMVQPSILKFHLQNLQINKETYFFSDSSVSVHIDFRLVCHNVIRSNKGLTCMCKIPNLLRME